MTKIYQPTLFPDVIAVPNNAPQVIPTAPNPNAQAVADLYHTLLSHGHMAFGELQGGITDYQVGPNHGGPRMHAINTIRAAVLGLSNQEAQDISNALHPGTVNILAQLDINIQLPAPVAAAVIAP
jgi:hypothetical protein